MPTQKPSQPSNVPSTLDFSFGDFGTRVLEGTEVKAIVVLKAEGVNQGKIIGVISTGTGTFKLFRLNKTGELDTTFGPAGTGYSEDRFGATTSLSTPSRRHQRDENPARWRPDGLSDRLLKNKSPAM